jgi:hypothetical protein
MKELHGKGLAIHPGPESCAGGAATLSPSSPPPSKRNSPINQPLRCFPACGRLRAGTIELLMPARDHTGRADGRLQQRQPAACNRPHKPPQQE